jgi:hypothetical protein
MERFTRITHTIVALFLLSCTNTRGSAGDLGSGLGLAVEKGEAKKIIVKNHSATMYQHKKFYITLSSGPVGRSAEIPTAISLGNAVFVKDKQLTVKHIFWTRHLERAESQGKVLAEAGSVSCVIVQTLHDLPDNDEDRWGDKLWIHVSDCQLLE